MGSLHERWTGEKAIDGGGTGLADEAIEPGAWAGDGLDKWAYRDCSKCSRAMSVRLWRPSKEIFSALA